MHHTKKFILDSQRLLFSAVDPSLQHETVLAVNEILISLPLRNLQIKASSYTSIIDFAVTKNCFITLWCYPECWGLELDLRGIYKKDKLQFQTQAYPVDLSRLKNFLSSYYHPKLGAT